MNLGTMMYQLLVSVVAHITSFMLTLVDFLLRVSPVMLSPVATRVEALVAEETFEWFLSSMNSFMYLEVRFCVELSTTCFLNSYLNCKYYKYFSQ